MQRNRKYKCISLSVKMMEINAKKKANKKNKNKKAKNKNKSNLLVNFHKL